MPDKFGHRLKTGDKVVWDSPKYGGLITGVLAADEEEFDTIRINRDKDGRLCYFQKNKYSKGCQPIMNLSVWFDEELDKRYN